MASIRIIRFSTAGFHRYTKELTYRDGFHAFKSALAFDGVNCYFRATISSRQSCILLSRSYVFLF